MTYIPTPALELTAGARLLIEQRKSGYVTDVPNSIITGAPLIPGQVDTGGRVFETDRSYSAVLPRFNALYRLTPDLNVFATVSKGRRSPVVQLSARRAGGAVVSNLQEVPEETVWNYEGGLKFASGIVSGSLGVYYQEYQGFQVSITQPDGTTVTRSAGSASNLGVEAELAANPTDWLSLFGNVGYIDGGIDDKPENGVFAGDRFRLQPEWQAAGGFTVDAPIGNGMRVFATPSVTYRSRIFFEVPNSPLISQERDAGECARRQLRRRCFEIAGLSAMPDEDYLLDAGNTGGARVPTFIPAEPRLYGVTQPPVLIRHRGA